MTREQKVIRAATRMMKERGHAILGIAPDSPAGFHRGAMTIEWGGAILPDGYVLRIEGRATRAQWQDQFKILFPGKKDPNGHRKGERFYRAVLVDLPVQKPLPKGGMV